MTKNKKNFFVGIISCGIMFIMGVLYLTVPTYYGIDYMAVIDVNDLFICMMLTYATLNLGEYIILGKSPNNENVWLSLAASTSGIINVASGAFVNDTFALSISVISFVI